MDDSAEILCQSFLQEAIVSASGMGRDVHSLVSSIFSASRSTQQHRKKKETKKPTPPSTSNTQLPYRCCLHFRGRNGVRNTHWITLLSVCATLSLRPWQSRGTTSTFLTLWARGSRGALRTPSTCWSLTDLHILLPNASLLQNHWE